jgi:4'-phosphopantetheinyl transferase
MKMLPSCFNLNEDFDANTVWVWQANLELPESSIDELAAILSTDEKERADRFHRNRDRAAFIAARGILRTLLAGYLQSHPDGIQFSYSDRGKPFLADGSLQFNVSHSGGLALYAIANNRSVGIDIESIRSIEVEQLAQRFFSDREYQQLCKLSDEQQSEAFFTYWTAKEAYLKATGEGLIGLQQVEILWEGDSLSVQQLTPEDSPQFFLQRLHPPPGYAAALAAEGQDWQLSYQVIGNG